MSNGFYRAFEDLHRGPRELIKKRLECYRPFFDAVRTAYPGSTAVDLGCGRGEWLEVLKDSGFQVHGVDLDEGMLEACKKLNLSVELADAISHISSMGNESASVISAFHVAEHISFEQLQSLVTQALRVLKPGGLLILETPNPENLVVATCSFYLDPTHERPIPPLLLSFLAEHAGFARVKTLRLQESKELAAQETVSLRDVFSGVSPDFAIVAQKVAAPEVMTLLDDPFSQDYGLSMDSLLHRWDMKLGSLEALAQQALHHAQQADNKAQHAEQSALQAKDKAQHAETRAHQAENLARQAEIRALEAECKAQQAEIRALHAENKAQQAEISALHSETKAKHAEANVHALLYSTSWRVTGPLRLASQLSNRFLSAVRERRVVSGLKRRLHPVIYRSGHWVMHNPKLREPALSLLNRMPQLKVRLRHIILGPGPFSPANWSAPAQAGGSPMSPRTARLYTELKNAIDSRQN